MTLVEAPCLPGIRSDSKSEFLPIRAAARCQPKISIKPSHLDVHAVINQFSLDGSSHQMLLLISVTPQTVPYGLLRSSSTQGRRPTSSGEGPYRRICPALLPN